MKKVLVLLSCFLLLLANSPAAFGQQKVFHRITQMLTAGSPTSIIQDRQGYIWFGRNTNGGGRGGLYRYDGAGRTTVYLHNANDTNSLSNNWVEALCMDSSGRIWIGMHGGGLDKFDPATKIFTHFSHNHPDFFGITSDTVNTLLTDHLGNLWVGTDGGLYKVDAATGELTHYTCDPDNASTISNNVVRNLYEDHSGNLWVGCGSPWKGTPQSGGLNLFNREKDAFTRYLHDPSNPGSISNNKITAMYEDSRKNLWIGTAGNGLQTLNKKTGIFTHYPYDPAHPEKLSAPPLIKKGLPFFNVITFIREDAAGNLWIGSSYQGIQKYDPETKKITHYGYLYEQPGKSIAADTASGYISGWTWKAFNSKEGLLWICAARNLYYINPFQKEIPYYPIKQPSANAFYQDVKGGFWIATDAGLLYRPAHGSERLFVHDPHNPNSLTGSAIGVMLPDRKGNLWLGTYPGAGRDVANGLDKWDPSTGTFTHYIDSGMLKGNGINALCLDHNRRFLWVGSGDGLYQLNTQTGKFVHHYIYHTTDSNGLNSNIIYALLAEGNKLWAGTTKGLDLLDEKKATWQHYLSGSTILSIYKDNTGVLWVGTPNGLYRHDSIRDHFDRYEDPATGRELGNVLNIIEDDDSALWISCTDAVYRINAGRNTMQVYGPQNGVHPNTFLLSLNYKAKDGKLYLGDQSGYYAFYPDKLNNKWIRPAINITGFQLGSKEVLPGKNSPLKVPVFLAKKIELGHTQNAFSFYFSALHYANPGEEHYRYLLKNYDTAWHDIGARNRAYFFNMPPGDYMFKVRAVNPNGAWSEKDIAVIIMPPWWSTWWAILIFIFLLASIIWGIVYYRSRQLLRENKLLEEKVNHRTRQLKQSLEDLKSAQKQLIQSEKMASLGELTAGIAHEIQNPLNFVNNFSEVSVELIEEMTENMNNGQLDEVKQLAGDLSQNLQKISFHGKRAEAIVKSMLQHSRGSSGHKEPVDINALADEYLRLSYHGLRARDKSFNADMKTDFDKTIDKINVVPQDIGRVLMNLYNNAFYACIQKSQRLKTGNPKLKTAGNGYDPIVSVSTKKHDGKIAVSVKDNGDGIPQKALDKIFQPFFTTKPTGEGTGLGLSLSYEIIKVHNGEIKVNTKEKEGTEFIVMLPANDFPKTA